MTPSLLKPLLFAISITSTVFAPVSIAAEQSDEMILSADVTGEGRDIVLIPGLMSDARVWQQATDALDDHYRVHQLSIAGFGEVPAHAPLRESFLATVRPAIADYLSQHTRNAAVIGHSLGGLLTYQLALTNSDALSCGVAVDGVPFFSALVTMNPQITADQARPRAQQMLAGYQQLSSEAMARQTQAGVARQTQSQQGQQTIVEMATTSDPQTVGRAMYEVMVTDLRPQLEQLQVPILQMAATGAFPEAQRSMALPHYQQQVSGSELITLLEFDKAHHFIMWDQPQAFITAAQDFIQEQCHD